MSAYAGTGRLIRLAVRRDRVQLPIWIALGRRAGGRCRRRRRRVPRGGGTGRRARGAGGSAAVLLMRGAPVGTDLGATVNFRNYAFMLVLAALMSTFAMIRHTRQNEETGRAEMIGAGGVAGTPG
ncbi:hypothetical protein ACFQX6_27920 [Streptosporangium lutulentum]